jgi:hypothetical protein
MSIKRWLRRQCLRVIPQGMIVAAVQRQALADAGGPYVITCNFAPEVIERIETLMCDLNWEFSDVVSTGIMLLDDINTMGRGRYQIIRNGTPLHFELRAKPAPKPKHDPVG